MQPIHSAWSSVRWSCIAQVGQLSVQVKMVTGDQHAIAVETSRRLGLGTDIMDGKELMRFSPGHKGFAQKVTEVDGFAGVYPEHKHRIVEALQATGRLVGMTGRLLTNTHVKACHCCSAYVGMTGLLSASSAISSSG